MARITFREALSRGLREALDNDSRVFLMGEDIGAYGGAYAVTKGFLKEFGTERVRDTPISESVIAGAGVGSAMTGLRPVVEIMTINFSLLAIDQIVNHAAKMRYMSAGQLSVPLIIRTVTGGGAQLAATHSQNLETWYGTVPGLKVIMPSTPYDALGLLRSAFQDNNPILFAEHALLYGTRGEVPDERYTVPIGKADIKRKGKDLTIIAYGLMVNTSLSAANEMASLGVEAEVVDLRTLRPLDEKTVLESVMRTGRAVVVEEAWRTGGLGAEVASVIQEKAFDYLDGPVARVGGEEVPMPYARNLERAAIPSAKKIIDTVKKVIGL